MHSYTGYKNRLRLVALCCGVSLLLIMMGPRLVAVAQTERALADEVADLRAEVQRLRDAQDIRELLYRYARGLDRHDQQLEASVFWPDAQINYGYYSGTRDQFVAWGNVGHAVSTQRHQHFIANQTVAINGDIAHVETYVLYMLRARDGETTSIGGARYIDKLERRGGEWRIAVREFLPDTLVVANSGFNDKFAANWCPPGGCGTWDRTDLSYRRPLERRPDEEMTGDRYDGTEYTEYFDEK